MEKEVTVPITRWCVITGAPCSGKTAVINELARRGFRVVPEAARSHIDAELKQGRSLAQIKADPSAFEGRILREKLTIEAGLPMRELIFLDRALPDSIAYYSLEGLDSEEPRLYSRKVRYRRIFLLNRLRFIKDPIRSENAPKAAQIERLIAEAYGSLGYDIIRVPLMPIAQRVDYVIKLVE